MNENDLYEFIFNSYYYIMRLKRKKREIHLEYYIIIIN
jgi:hypothetical protein